MTENTQKAKETSSLKKNFLYQASYDVLLIILPFILSPYLARVLGAEGLGVFSYYFVIANYFVLFAVLGIKNYGKRLIAQCRDDQNMLNENFSNLFALHAVISVIVCLAYGVYILCFAENQLFALIMSLIVVSALFNINWLFFGLEQFKLTVARNFAIKILTVGSIFAFVHEADDLWIYCLIMALGTLLSQLTLWISLKRFVKFVKPDIHKMLQHLKPILILFIPAVAVSLYKQMDKVMIDVLSEWPLSGSEQLGFYDNAEKVVNLPLTVITSFGAVMLPKMANLVANKDTKSVEQYTKLSCYYMMGLAYALTFGLAGVSSVFAPVFWGTGFEPAAPLILGLSMTLPFLTFASIIRMQYLIPSNMDKEFVLSVSSGAVVNLILNFFLIPSMGARGAMIATIVAEFSVFFVQCWAVRKMLPVFAYFRSSLVFIPIAAAMFGLVYWMGTRMETSVTTLLLQIGVGALFYSVCTAILLYIKKDRFFMQILAKLKQ